MYCQAVYIFCLFARTQAFTEFQQYHACAVAHFIAAKVQDKHPKLDWYEEYTHKHAPNPRKVKGSTERQVAFESRKEWVREQTIQLEIDMLTVCGFDFDLQLPVQYMVAYGAPDSLISQCIDSVFLQRPDRAYFLFFGPELIAAAFLQQSLDSEFDLGRFNDVNRTRVALEDCQMLALDLR